MPTKYTFIDHTADLGFKVYGSTLEELFVHAGEAFSEALVDLATVKEKIERTFEVESDALDNLMVNWLDELLYVHDTEGMVFRHFEVRFLEENHLKAKALGEELDPERHEIKAGIKAVTYHQLYVEKRGELWEAQVIFDV